MKRLNVNLPLIVLLTLPLFYCGSCEDDCGAADTVIVAADLVVDAFEIAEADAEVNEIVGTAVEIINFLFKELVDCEEQANAGESFSDYKVFYRENENDDWEFMGESNEFMVPTLTSEEKFETDDNGVEFMVSGEYYLVCAADIGNDVEEANENNNEKQGDTNIQIEDFSVNSGIIKVYVTPNTDLELMEKNKKEGNYVTFHF